jgi:hypothetical protein
MLQPILTIPSQYDIYLTKNTNKVVKHDFCIIELEIIVYYTILHLTHYKIRAYYLVIRIHSELTKHLICICIQVTPVLHSYLIIFVFAYVFILKIWKRIWEGHYPIHIHPYLASIQDR